VPYHFDRHFLIAVLHRCHVAEEIVTLRFIVVQPTNYFVGRRPLDEDHRLSPDDVGPLYCGSEFFLERLRRRIGFGATMRNILLCCW